MLGSIRESLGAIKAMQESQMTVLTEIRTWQKEHDGQGEGTTHAAIWKRLQAHSDELTRTKTLFGVIIAGASALWTALVAWWK